MDVGQRAGAAAEEALPAAAAPAAANGTAAEVQQVSKPQMEQQSSPAVAAVEPPAKRPRKGGRGRGAVGAAAPDQDELVRLGPVVVPNSERLRTGWRPVQLSAEDKAAGIKLNDRQLAASSSAGYRMVRATHGAYTGTWYFEVRIEQLGSTGAARVGWATRQAELNAPVGADGNGFSYRSKGGSKVHAAWRDDYGEAYGEGDVIGCLLHLPEGGRPLEKGPADVVRYKKMLYFPEGGPEERQKLPGSFVAFTRNGKLQGKAYEGILEGTYYPAISLYTDRSQQQEEAKVAVNFGDSGGGASGSAGGGGGGFAFPLPDLEGCPLPRPACELSGQRPGGPAATAATQQTSAQQQASAEQQQAASGQEQHPAHQDASQQEQQQQEQQERQPADEVPTAEQREEAGPSADEQP